MTTTTTILVVDDHPLYRDALVSAIRSLGDHIEVSVTGTFEAAMKALEENGEMDLVLLDLNMPDSKGFPACRKCGPSFSRCPWSWFLQRRIP